jgi:WhiB family redox-sensing transcriptional regulator
MNPEKTKLNTKWMDEAACKEMGPELFTSEKPIEIRKAKAICAGCAVVKACLEYALENNEHYIWGGKTEKQRKRIKASERLKLNRRVR